MGFAAIKEKTSFLIRKLSPKIRLVQLEIPSLNTSISGGTNPASLMEEYCEWLELSGNLPSTVYDYRKRINTFFTLADIDSVQQLDEASVLRQFDAGSYSPRTRAIRLCALRSFCEFAKSKGILSHNPLKDTKMGGRHTKSAPTKIPEIDLKKIGKVLDAKDYGSGRVDCRETQSSIAVKLILATGVRHSELRNICGSDMDMSSDSNNLLIKIRGKGARDRYVPISKKSLLCAQLWALKAKAGTNKRLFYLLPASSFGKDIKLATEQLLGTKLAPHQLRHYYARYWYYERKISITAVSIILGHSSIHTTQRYLDQRQAKAFEEMRSAWIHNN